VSAGESPPTLRLYCWSSPALSIGYAQDRDRDVDTEACRARGIAVIRRITGGRAVLHDAEVTYSVSAPAGQPGFGSGLEAAYRHIAAGLVAGLRLLGLQAALAVPGARGPAPPSRAAACFAATSRHEIAVDGRKLVGSAQRREGGAFLQHGSVLLRSHGALADRLLRRPPGEGAGAGMAGLSELLPAAPSPEAVTAAIAAGCAAAWGVVCVPGGASLAEVRAARALELGRYRSAGWNAGRLRERDAAAAPERDWPPARFVDHRRSH
jgi:lipoate-protein ligase A